MMIFRDHHVIALHQEPTTDFMCVCVCVCVYKCVCVSVCPHFDRPPT